MLLLGGHQALSPIQSISTEVSNTMNISQKLEAIAEALDKIGGVMTQIKNEWDDKESPHELENARELLAEVADVVEGEAWRYRSQTQSYPPDEPEYCLVCERRN